MSVDVNTQTRPGNSESANAKKHEVFEQPMDVLLHAIEQGNVSIVESFISKGINMSVQLDNGKTPIHVAARKGHVVVVKFLIQHGADINAQTQDRETALHMAAYQGHAEIVKFLIEHGANINAQTKDGWTALFRAEWQGHAEIVKFLIEHDANVNAQDKDGYTALHLAVQEGHVEVVKFLIEHGANVTAQTKNGYTPIYWAAQQGHAEIVKFLIEHGANINSQTQDGWTALHRAAQQGHLEVVKFLIARGADLNLQTQDGWTAFHSAAWLDNAEMVKILIEHGFYVNAKTQDGWTALHLAAWRGQTNAVRELINNGANIFAEDEQRKSPIDLANEKGQKNTFKILKDAAAKIRNKVPAWPFVLSFIFMIAILLVAIYHIFTSLRNRLRLGKLIGRGNFSDVYIGELLPINPFSQKKKVVIKSIKASEGTDPKFTGIAELLAEINIVKRLPKHRNVVGFIGAVGTRNALKGGIKIVYEFCPYGDLSSFLKKNRQSAVSQCETNEKTIGDYVGSSEYIEENPKEKSEKSFDSPLTPTFPFTTTDLLNWSVQVASGLLSLASNEPPIIHCDLAARNILLCENKTVKIGDFGLSRRLNGKGYYKKTSWAPDPVPWMAIESRPEHGTEQKFSVKSDVWSFGVVIWELYSEGIDPYYYTMDQLKSSIRLRKPEKATEEIYSLMISCWKEDSKDRPTFDHLEKALSNMYSDVLKRDGVRNNDNGRLMTVTVDAANLRVSANVSSLEKTSDATEDSDSSSS
ncbi:serine/threonine-protein kinase TNNI3K-like [Sitodiplosis mosellana]|uniref:serine/threonine-protein kinase TNNI3K-like n=1 Tax=Sitodiplosis mosellana TaxID=263140 RepID=UPI002444D020|nr:serine/threonine-protein kinase TNNI3K-like [Sitodiplosis mosellana]